MLQCPQNTGINALGQSCALISNLKIDYYQINMEDQISQLNITSVINNCVESQSISSYWCRLINRANDGTLSTSGSFVSTPLFNLSEFDTSGIDLKFTYLT